MRSRNLALIKLTCISVITLSFCIESFAQDKQIESLIKALEHAKKPADNMRVKFTKERDASSPSGTLGKQIEREPASHYLFDYNITISGIRSKIESDTSFFKTETDSQPYDITKEIEISDGTYIKSLTWKPNQNDFPNLGSQKLADIDNSDISYRIYGWPMDITKVFYKNPSSFSLASSEDPNIYILEIRDAALHRVYIDSEKNFNIVKWQTLNPEEDIPMCELNYKFKQTNDGIWYPSEYQTLFSSPLSSGERSSLKVAEKVKIHSAEFNIDIPEDTFTLEFPVGTRVRDKFIGGRYIVSDSNSP